MKQSQHGRNGDDRCTKCNLHPERTTHLIYHCTVATNLWNQLKLHVNSYLQENDPQEQIQINLDTILFHQTTMGVYRNNIIYLMMTAIYVLYRSRFLMQNPHRISLRFLILNMVLTLAKTVNLEKEQ